MSTLSKKDINERLLKKGFCKIDTDHHCYYYVYNGRKTNISTKFSMGSGKDIGDSLISIMAKQVRLNKADFMKLIQCTLSKEEYRDLMIKNGNIPIN